MLWSKSSLLFFCFFFSCHAANTELHDSHFLYKSFRVKSANASKLGHGNELNCPSCETGTTPSSSNVVERLVRIAP